jgi:dipeptidyl aminopeptidase/acylaminoacyl peptidase
MHAMDDPAVPVENSFIMLRALRTAGRPVEAHFYEEGGHGFGLGSPALPARSWIELFANWIDRQETKAA